MSLILNHSVDEQEGCTEWNFIDESGIYLAVAPINLTGYGTPNAASNNVTFATIKITPYGYTSGYLFTFTIAANVITAATVTSPSGVITIITPLLTSTVFPFSTIDPFVIIGEWLGMGVNSQMVSSAYNFEYEIYDGKDYYTSSSDEIIVCQVCCCATNLEADLTPMECSTCEDKELERATRVAMWLDSAICAMEDGDVDKAYANLMYAKELCAGGCQSCG